MLYKTAIDNIHEIIKFQYPYIMFNTSDMKQFCNIPEIEKNYYKVSSYALISGFLVKDIDNRIAFCSTYAIDSGTIKIALKVPKDFHNGWSDALSIVNKDDARYIYKYIKLAHFW